MSEQARSGLASRRAVLRGAVGGGALLWSAPVVQVLAMGTADAASGDTTPPPPPDPCPGQEAETRADATSVQVSALSLPTPVSTASVSGREALDDPDAAVLARLEQAGVLVEGARADSLARVAPGLSDGEASSSVATLVVPVPGRAITIRATGLESSVTGGSTKAGLQPYQVTSAVASLSVTGADVDDVQLVGVADERIVPLVLTTPLGVVTVGRVLLNRRTATRATALVVEIGNGAPFTVTAADSRLTTRVVCTS